MDHFYNDINELNELQDTKWASVLHPHQYYTSTFRKYIASILEHSAGSSVTITPDALRWAIRHIINMMSKLKKKSYKMLG